MNKGFLNKKMTGLLLISFLVVVLFLKIFLSLPFIFLIGSIFVTFLGVLFLHNPSLGIILLLVFRVAIDRIGNDFNINFNQNFSININALLGIIAIGMTLFYLFSIKKLPKKKTKNLLFILTAWSLYLMISSISIFFSIDKKASAYELLRLLSILSFFILGFFTGNFKKASFIPKLIFYSSIIPLSFAFYQLIAETGMGRVAGLQNRLFGTFSDPNSFAAFCLIAFGILIYYLSQKKAISIKENWKEYSILGFLILILLATFSRGGWLAFLIFLTIFTLIKKPKLLLLLFISLILLTSISEPVRDRLEDVYNPPITSSVYWRFEQWSKMTDLFKKQPWTGYGIGTEIVVHEKEFGFYAGNPYTHNDILKNALETGIFGALSYLILIITTSIILLIKYFQEKNKKYRDLILVIFLIFLVEFTFSLTSNILRTTVIQWITWFLVGFVLTKSSSKN
jgi:O-antigen ligase